MAYVDAEYYTNTYGGKNGITDFERVSHEIDSMTFNRIVAKGFDNLSDFQKSIVQDVACRMADFEYDNEGLVSGGLSSYSINGVNVSFDKGWGVIQQDGIIIPAQIYEELKQTGLCWRYI